MVLKPCPFCGESKYLQVIVTEPATGEHKGSKSYDIHCIHCGTFTQFCIADTETQLIRKWNVE